MKQVILFFSAVFLFGCQDSNIRVYHKAEGYGCVENCTCLDCPKQEDGKNWITKGCDFTNSIFYVYRADHEECSKLAFNDVEELYGNTKWHCQQFDATEKINIFSTDGNAPFNCSGDIIGEQIILHCQAGKFNGEQQCQDATFEKLNE